MKDLSHVIRKRLLELRRFTLQTLQTEKCQRRNVFFINLLHKSSTKNHLLIVLIALESFFASTPKSIEVCCRLFFVRKN